MPKSTQTEKARKRAMVIEGKLVGATERETADRAGCGDRHARRLSAEPETQILITELMRPYLPRLQGLVPKCIRAVERGLMAQKTTKSDLLVQLHAVHRAKELMTMAQGPLAPPTEPQANGSNVVTWEQWQLVYNKVTSEAA